MIVNTTQDGAIAVTPVASGTKTADVGLPKTGVSCFSGLLVAAAGTVVFTDAQGNVVTISGSVPAGTFIPVKCVNVINTSGATLYGTLGVA